MHGREGEDWKRSRRHMWSVPNRGTTTSVDVAVGGNSTSSSNSFYKDGRKINVGDCALFKPPQDSPPFIGIIRWLTAGRENNWNLGVNWLYRPSEVKLGKGILLEAAPNEVFYSFHKDEIPAASLLHPCKVAFLSKGVELPSGVPSFVCRRVYDIANKSLWWLTDQDYIDERQEEVDQLLHKTRIEMHATVQPGGRSPKPMNGPTSTLQLKPGSDSVQNSGSSYPSQVKGKKRERGDQGYEPVKRERSLRTEDGDSGHFRPESILKFEISKITDKGGLADSEAVERLVQLMLPEKVDKKIDLADRSMLAGVVAATDKFDCLSRFVELKGLPVLDEWLQEVHKGKIGDGSSQKDNDKSVEEFLLVLLRALDKLPVNLYALQMCNIGKSVNHLRTHKNLEIQRKARSLVDTWKKRVEAEMSINDGNPGSNQAVSWPARSRPPEVSQGGNRHPGGSEVGMKSSVTQLSASKTTSAKLSQGENVAKSTSASLGSTKSAPSPASMGTNLKDAVSRTPVGGSSSDLPLTPARDEKSSSSSQSHNSQSCSSEHVKTAGSSGKEDARSSTAGSMSVNKISGGPSRHRKSISGLLGPAVSGVQRESGSSRSSSFHRNTALEKISHSGLTSEKALDVPVADGNSHKLIVKIPNRGRSPAQSASGGSFDDPSMSSRASSPVLSEKHDQFDRCLKEKNDAYRANATADANNESWQSNDFKEVLTGSDEGDGSPADIPNEERFRATDDTRKVPEVSKATSSSSGNELKPEKRQEVSFSSMNALIESCVKYSEANVSMSVGDDVGMNLLASVAAGEMSKSDVVAPAVSPQNSHIVEDSCTGNNIKLKSSHADTLARERRVSNDKMVEDGEKQDVVAGTLLANAGDRKNALSSSEEKPAGEWNEVLASSSVDIQQTAVPCMETSQNSDELIAVASMVVSPVSKKEKATDSEGGQVLHEAKPVVDGVNAEGSSNKPKVSSSLLSENKENNIECEKEADKGSTSHLSIETVGRNQNFVNEGLNSPRQREQKPPPDLIKNQSDLAKDNHERLLSSGSAKQLDSGNVNGMMAEKTIEIDTKSHVNETDKPKMDRESNVFLENQIVANSVASAATDCKVECMEKNLEGKEVIEHHSGGKAFQKMSSSVPFQEMEPCVKSGGSKLSNVEADKTEECASASVDMSLCAAGGSDMEAKLEFDLNEGFNADEGKYGELSSTTAPSCSAAVHLISPFPFPVSSVSSGLPASITLATAAKGPFVPPEDLLRSKGELGWKGSAATSAFRPAEPRKVLDMPLNTTSVPVHDTRASKNSRPLLDFDLNVPDERMLEDMASRNSTHEADYVSNPISNYDVAHNELLGTAPVRCFGGLDLDLNRVDEATEIGQYSASNSRKIDITLLPADSPSSGGLPNGELSARRNFDLNNGPLLEEVSAEPASLNRHVRSKPSQPHVSSLRMNNAEMGSFSAWFPPGNTYSTITIPAVLPDRGEQSFTASASGGPQRVFTGPAGGISFAPDGYRGPVLSSSPAVHFPPPPFQYPVFPFGTSFPLSSASMSGGSTAYMDSSSSGRIYSQLLGPAGAVSSSYPRPCVVSIPDGNINGGVESSRKWGRQGLDLNAGPGGPEIEGRDETLPFASRQLSVASSQALAEEQARMLQMAGSILKRKEPEGGWDIERYKQQSSWQ